MAELDPKYRDVKIHDFWKEHKRAGKYIKKRGLKTYGDVEDLMKKKKGGLIPKEVKPSMGSENKKAKAAGKKTFWFNKKHYKVW